MGAMEQRRDLVFFLVLRQDFSSECFRIVLGLVAEELRIDVVPAAPQIVGDTVNDNKMIMRVVDAAAHKLNHIAVADPSEKLARLARPIGRSEGADAQAGYG